MNELYKKYYKLTRNYALRALGRDYADYADDIAQDTWAGITKRGYVPPLLAPPHPELARQRYLFTIVARRANRLKWRLRREQQKQTLAAQGEEITSGKRQLTRRSCEICNRPCRYGRRLCEAHYYRRRRHGAKADMSPHVNTWRKLSDVDVRSIRAASAKGEKGAALARKYGVGTAQISRIINRRQRT